MKINRKLKSLNNKTGAKIKSEIVDVLNNHDKYKNCYFWTNTGNAANRRRQEFENELEFIINDKIIQVEQSLSISCKNFYFSTRVYVDGSKKDIRVLKKLIT